MADVSTEKTKEKGQTFEEKPKKIRFTLTSRDVKALENVTSKLISSAKKERLVTYGPVRHPTKVLRLTTRRSPCGNGTSTFDRFEMRIHKRVITLICPTEYIKKVTNITIDPGVDIDLVIAA